jgi:long-chain acyl-CoA synthetase
MNPETVKSAPAPLSASATPADSFWRVEGSLLNFSAVRTVAFFTWNAHSFAERWARRGGLTFLAIAFPFLYAIHRVFATRVLYSLLRGVSRDRLDLLGEEYFHYVIKPRLKRKGAEKLSELLAADKSVVLVSHGLDHVMRPLARHLGVGRLVANRLEFRDGFATGRLLEPVIRPRGGLAWLLGRGADGRIPPERLSANLGFPVPSETLQSAIRPASRELPARSRTRVLFDGHKRVQDLSVRKALAGKHILLIGVTGFIGKVWLEKALHDTPDVACIHLLIRPQRGSSAWRRFEKIVEESPVFDRLCERYGNDFSRFLSDRVEVLEGDVSQPDLGLGADVLARLRPRLDLVVNSSGLTEFNPDLRQALAINLDGVAHLLAFLRRCDHAALLHLSTCYVAGARDGRVTEELPDNYNPAHRSGFDVEQEWQSLNERVKQAQARAEGPELSEELRRQVLRKNPSARNFSAAEMENHLRRHRSRWLRTHLTEAGTRRANELGWPNTYTFTKSLAESLIQKRGADLPVAVVRPSIVESSIEEPLRGWNEGVNTSGPLSYLLGTYFRQLPTNERKCLDLIPVDVVARGMMLIAAALVERRQQRLYQLATSAVNPCNMGRSIELTALAHRKHYRARQGLERWLRMRFDTIPVSKERYRKFSAPRQKVIVRVINRVVSPFFPRPPLARQERDLARVEKLIELYEPFILYNEHVFEAENVDLLSHALVPEEKAAFGYHALSLDWWDYWINIHVPALRKWCYPLLEGRPLEARPRRRLQLPRHPKPGPAPRPGDESRVSEATWPSS